MAAVVAGQFSSIQRPSCSSSNPPSPPPRAPHPTQATLSQTRSHLGVGCCHQLPTWRVQADSGTGHLHRPRFLRSPPRINRSHLRRLPRPCLRCLLCRTLSIVGGATAEISRPHLPHRHRSGVFANEWALGSCQVGSQHRVSV